MLHRRTESSYHHNPSLNRFPFYLVIHVVFQFVRKIPCCFPCLTVEALFCRIISCFRLKAFRTWRYLILCLTKLVRILDTKVHSTRRNDITIVKVLRENYERDRWLHGRLNPPCERSTHTCFRLVKLQGHNFLKKGRKR